MNIITARILDVSNAFQNTNVPIHERFCVYPSPYYLDWFENPILMFLSIFMSFHFFFNVWMGFKVKNHQDESVIYSSKQWLQFWNTRKSKLIIPSTLRYFMMVLSHILHYILMMFWIIIIMINPLLNSVKYFNHNLRSKFKKYISLNIWIFGFLGPLLVSVLIRLITSWIWSISCSQLENLF